MDPITLAIILGVSALVGVTGNIASAAITNKANKDMASDTNDLIREQNQQSIDLYHEDLKYNSPVEQMKRLRATGLSRGQALNSIASGSTSLPSLSSNFVTPTYTAPDVASPLASGASNLLGASNLSADMETSNRSLDIQQQLADNDTNRVTSELRIGEHTIMSLDKNTELTGAQIESTKAQLRQIDASIEQTNEQIKLMQSQRQNTDADTYRKNIDNMYAHEQNQAIVDQIYSQIRNLDANTKLTRQQCSELVQSWVYRSQGMEYDAKIKVYEYEKLLPEQLKGLQISNNGVSFQYYAQEQDWKHKEGIINTNPLLQEVNIITSLFGNLLGGLVRSIK